MRPKKKKKDGESEKRDRGRPPVDKKEPPEPYDLDVNFDLNVPVDLDNTTDDMTDDMTDADMDVDNDVEIGPDGIDGAVDDSMTEGEPEVEGTPMVIWKSTRYGVQIRKGNVGDVDIVMWDKVRDCRSLDCPLFKSCHYMNTEAKRKKAAEMYHAGKRIGRCGVEMKYIHHIEQPFLAMMQKSPEPFIMQTIGMHLIPLYHDLIQLKIEKAGLKEITYKDSKGTLRIHPVFDQIEKTHKAILNVWRSSRLMRFAEESGFFKAGGQMLPKDDLDEYGAMAFGVKDAVPVMPAVSDVKNHPILKPVKATVVKKSGGRWPKKKVEVVEPEPVEANKPDDDIIDIGPSDWELGEFDDI